MKRVLYKFGDSTRWKPTDPTQRMRTQIVNFARTRARAKGREFDITVQTLVWPEFCPVLGLKLDYSGMRRVKDPCLPSLDRVDSSKGYTRDNVRVISWRANWLKANGTMEEHEAIAKYMRDHI